uniref:C-type lectin domain-containing protein n=1 Tax=Panagrolaimus sp. ES5 TaxID=591445 RepID=A0AC34F693_9BILA
MKFYCCIFISFQLSLILASCPNGSVEWQNGCYLFQSNATTFATATSKCISEGGQLTSIHDGLTNAILAQQGQAIFLESTVSDFWIGLTNLMPSESWTWVDNTTFDFNDWASGEPRNITEKNCAAILLTNGFWVTEECYKIKPYVCRIEKINYQTTTPTADITTTRAPFTPNQQCVSTSLNIYLNYFFDMGRVSGSLIQIYLDIITQTTAEAGVGNPTRWLSIYGANENGSTFAPLPFAQSGDLLGALGALSVDPYYSATTSSVTDDLRFYSNVLNTQLNYTATPVIVMFLNNLIDDVPASIAKMNAVKNASPKTYFMGVFFSTDPTLSQLPFDYTLNFAMPDNTAAETAVLNIFNFICTVSSMPNRFFA